MRGYLKNAASAAYPPFRDLVGNINTLNTDIVNKVWTDAEYIRFPETLKELTSSC